ncbi:MAG: AMP-binding protein [Ferroplasma sp.]
MPENRNKNLSEFKNLKFEGSFNLALEIFEKLFSNLNKKAVIYINTESNIEKSVTYNELCQNYNKFINFLRSKNIKKGANIYVMFPSIVEQRYIMFGALKAGYTIMPTAPNITEYELKFRFQNDGPNVPILDYDGSAKIKKASNNNPSKLIVGQSDSWKNIDDIPTFPGMVEPEKLCKDVIVIKYFTSGTTSMPKNLETARSINENVKNLLLILVSLLWNYMQ